MAPRHPSKQGTSFHTYCRHWACLGNQRKPAIPSESETKPTTEMPKCRHPPSTPKPSLQESAKDCLNWQQSQKQTRIYRWADKIRPQHFQALQHTGPITKKVPTLTEKQQHIKEAKALKTSWGQFQQQTQQKENNLLLCWLFQHECGPHQSTQSSNLSKQI